MQFNSRGTSIQNVFASGGFFLGDFVLTSSLRLDGTLHGNVLTDDRFFISTTGRAFGIAKASIIDISGFFQGDLFASNIVIIRSTGVVKGRIRASFIEVEEGASYTGFANVSFYSIGHSLVASFVKRIEETTFNSDFRSKFKDEKRNFLS